MSSRHKKRDSWSEWVYEPGLMDSFKSFVLMVIVVNYDHLFITYRALFVYWKDLFNILKHLLQNFMNILRKYYMDTTCMEIYVSSLNI